MPQSAFSLRQIRNLDGVHLTVAMKRGMRTKKFKKCNKKKVDYEFFCRALRTMIDLGRITEKCTDCPQIMPIAGDLTMNGANRHIYRLGYKGAQSFGVKVSFSEFFYFLKL